MTDEAFRKLDELVFVAPQLQPEDFARARAAGVRTVINNRPDGEAPDQIPSAEAERLARAEGLAYRHVPLRNGGLSPAIAAAFAAVLDEGEGPYLAFCRSGTRSTYLWALAAARRLPVDEVIARAAAAGYDIAGARPLLEQAAAQGSASQT